MKKFLLFIALYGVVLNTLNSQSASREDFAIQKEVELKIKSGSVESISAKKKKEKLIEAFDLLTGIRNDSLKLKLLSNLSYYIEPQDSAFFRKVNNTTKELAMVSKDSVALAYSFWDLGYFYNRISVKDSSYYSYYEAQKIFEQLGESFLSARMLYNMAKQQQEVRDYIGSEANTIAAIERLKPLNKYKELYNCYNTLAVNSQDLGEYAQAIEYYDQALYYLKNTEYKELDIKQNVNNRGMLYSDLGNYKKALENFEENLKGPSLANSNIELYSKTLVNIALTKLNLNETSGVFNLIKESIKINDSLKDIRGLASSYFAKSKFHLYDNDTLNAINSAEKAIELASESLSYERLLETYAFLAEIDNKNASKYAQKYIALNDSIVMEERQARNKFARIRFETDEFIAQNEQLEEETAILARQKQIWSGVALGFFLLGISVYIIINQRAKNQKLLFAQQQQANNQEIFNLMLTQKQKVDEVKRLEQKRISEELHDGVLGKMLGARMVLTGLNKRTGPEAIEARLEAINALKNVEQEVRSISHELSHSAYQKINNFINSIEDLLGTVKESSQIITIFNYDEDEDYDALKGEIKINLYRMIQEGLQNAIKHSDGKTFFVKFERNGDILNVEMGDDGKGFDLEKEKRGIGMRNISSRVEKLNGTWKVISEPMKGTTITLEIPLQHVDSNSQAALQKV
ncbi:MULTISPECIES: tetratricopeptide repeat-containing sensor histidine kinase [Maribacter]|uniref:histidine kinase n=1 Tax=Maribacter flavus TaxID=1658664 RepID=A0ABU7IIA0_9FLAO|nr:MULTISPECIES: tetratricopeptide repeat-containing sensor histidine kinase [Maribacter]MDC6405553.1 ATP-binding protein [Maribacter sp. PR66]MEE1972679.1 ATP-binding protein [Maribacter flavus]